MYAKRVIAVEQGTFTPLVYTTTGGIGKECQRFHSRLAELIAAKMGEQYWTSISWICTKVSFAIFRSAILCLRGSRTTRRGFKNLNKTDFEIQSLQLKSPSSDNYLYKIKKKDRCRRQSQITYYLDQ